MAFIATLLLLISPEEVWEIKDDFFLRGAWQAFALWLPWSILIDYVSLFKTRVILGVLTRLRRGNGIVALAILGIDIILYKLIFALGGMVIAGIVLQGIILGNFGWINQINPADWFSAEVIIPSIIVLLTSVPHPEHRLIFIFFWAGFAPSLWMWLYVLALFVTRALLRSEKLITWLRWGLDVEKNPFRSIGAVAAALAFVASVAIIVVSAEVSRISTAL